MYSQEVDLRTCLFENMPIAMVVKQRLRWVDGWRGILILLVVVGHVVGGASHLGPQGMFRNVCDGVYDVIYSFHMPAFFFLAGYVWRNRDEDAWGFVHRKFRRLMVPYLFYGIVSILIYCALLSVFNSARTGFADAYYTGKGRQSWWMSLIGLFSLGCYPTGESYRYNSVLWFLPCMFAVQTIFFGLLRMKLWRHMRLRGIVLGFLVLLSVMLRVLLHDIPLPVSMWRVPQFVLMMFCGYIWSLISSSRAQILQPAIVATMLIGYVLARLYMPNACCSYQSYFWSFAFICVALIGTLISYYCARLIPGNMLENIGRSSLTIMLLHKFIVVGMEVGLPPSRNILVGGGVLGILWMLVIATIAIVVCMLCNRIVRKVAPWSIGY